MATHPVASCKHKHGSPKMACLNRPRYTHNPCRNLSGVTARAEHRTAAGGCMCGGHCVLRQAPGAGNCRELPTREPSSFLRLHQPTPMCPEAIWHLSEARRSFFNNLITTARVEVFTAVIMKNAVAWDVTPCGSCKNRTSQASFSCYLLLALFLARRFLSP
jgi:hypothetical protein